MAGVHQADNVRIFHHECVSTVQGCNAGGGNCYEVYMVAPNVKDNERERVKICIR